jgi:2-polyprenyl-6-methoxyphenol hydroxylase-like FAD-dependent oxidoreductase
MVHYPLQGWKTFNLVATFATDVEHVGTNEPGTREEVLSRFGEIVPRARKLLEVPTEWRRWVLGDREPIENWTDGRVTLLGDAAHPTLQTLAQGACMAIEDGVCQAQTIERSGGDFENAFQQYQSARYLRTARVQFESRYLWDNFYHLDGIAREVARSAWSERDEQQIFECLAWLYDGFPLPDRLPEAA